MEKWIVFKEGQIKRKDGRFEYETNTKYRLNGEDSIYLYIGKDKFEKQNNDYDIGYIEKENIKRD